MKFEEIKKIDDELIMHTYKRFPIALDHGSGAALWDIAGKRYIDLNAGIGVSCLGHAHPALVQAVSEQAGKLLHVSNLYYTEPLERTAEKLIGASAGVGMKRVFFANSGAEANEGMLKIARKYAAKTFSPARHKVLSLKQSFHGRTIATLKATGQKRFHRQFGPFPEGFDYVEPNNLEDLKAHADETVCALLLELVQGESGVCPLDSSYVREAERFCRERGILLLIDEVQTGVGRTGTFLTSEQYGIRPDLISLAKGLGGGVPIGAVLAGESCCDVLEPGDHGTTFGGNALAASAACAVLDIVAEPEFLKEVTEKGSYFMDALRHLKTDRIQEVRGMGLMIGIEVPETELAADIGALMKNGVLPITAGSNVIRLLPPLVINYVEIDAAMAAFRRVFEKDGLCG